MQPYKPVKELKVEDALMYLDQVKVEFSEKPHIYNEFLEIMKNFKTQAINTPGVIERVKNLFRGYNKLILGFNTFLPEGEGYKIELTAEEEAQSFPGQSTIAIEPPPVPAPEPNISVGFKPPGQQMQQQHAISYVTTIRNRFSDQPETYRSFLRILHTYQKEQRGIKDVLEQVSTLFADHPDLLMEFTYFLPDAVQDQAKERLARAANDAKAKKAKQEAALQLAQQKLHALPITLPSSNSQLPSSSAMSGHSLPSKRKERELPRTIKEEKADRDRDQHRDRDRDRDSHRERDRPSIMASMQPLPPLGSVTVPTAIPSSLSTTAQPSGLPSNASAATTAAAVRRANKKRLEAQAPPPPPHAHSRESEAKLMLLPHSINAERKLFDQIKVALSTTREGWNEFLKCLELFITNVISKKEMYNMLRELLEPTPSSASGSSSELLEQFKKMLTSKTAIDSSSQEVWFGLPLSEIDFHQCRLCTPSYRALPEDFPVPVCSIRGELEKEVLNDKWVSIPIGSEESYSFKHMRKNQYEEILFKCEDERFEIDMVIDSNTATIKLLEPLYEEIQIIKMTEEQEGNNGTNNNSNNIHSNSNSNAPLTRLHFKLEKKNIGPVHIAAISRIYGENGPEIIDMLFKNPVGAIPVILKRLKQKDGEWKKARQDLNRQWKESQEKNFDRSLDHRSFYFRQQDKKSYSARMLVSEIKTIAETSSQFDTPLPVVPPVSTTHNTSSKDQLVDKNVLHTVPPVVQALAPDMKSHITLMYPHEDKAILQDVYSLMTYAAETSTMNANDKERVSALWRDLLRIFFNMPVHFLYRASATPSSVVLPGNYSNGNHHHHHGSSDTSSSSPPPPIDVAEAYPLHSRVLTIYGPAEVLGFRSFDSLYKVSLDWGIGYFHSSAVLGSEQLTIPALQAIGVTRDSHGREIIINVSPSDNNDIRVVPPCEVLYGTQICYVFVKMHHTLCTRLSLARQLATDITLTDKAEEAERRKNETHDHTKTAIDTETPASTTTISKIKPLYSSYLSQLISVIDGSLDSNRYEEACRQLLGHHSYPLYTLDKIVHQILKCLQVMSNDESVNKLVGLYMYHRQRSAGGGVDPKLYRKHVAQVLAHNLEDVYRIQYVTDTESSHRKETKNSTVGNNSKVASQNSYVLCQSLGVLSSGMTPVSSAARMNQMMELIPDAEEEEEEEEEEEDDPETEADTVIMHPGHEGSVSSGEDDDEEEEEEEEELEPATASKASSDPTQEDDHSLPSDPMDVEGSSSNSLLRTGRGLRRYSGRSDTRDSESVVEDEEEDNIDEEIAASAEGFSCMLAAAGELAQLDSDYRSGEFDFQYSSNTTTTPNNTTTTSSSSTTADHAIKSRAFIANQMIAGSNSGGPSSGDQPRHPSNTTNNNNSSSSSTVEPLNQRGVKRGLQEVWDAGASSGSNNTGGAESQGTEGTNPDADEKGTDTKLGEQRFRF